MFRKICLVLLCVAAIGFSAVGLAQESSNAAALKVLDDALPGDLINDPISPKQTTWGDKLSYETVEAEQTPGKSALQFKLKRAGKNPWDAGVNFPLTGDINPGDRIKIAVWARTVKAKTPDKLASAIIRLQAKDPPYDGFGDIALSPTKVWKLHEFDAVADKALKKESSQLVIQLAKAVQTVEIGQLYVLNLGPVK